MTVTTTVCDEVLPATIGAPVEMASQFRRMAAQQRAQRPPVMNWQTTSRGKRWQRGPQDLRHLQADASVPRRLAAERHA